jgi:hypothetical protein
MSRARRQATLLIPLLLFAFACSENPTAPTPSQAAPESPELGILTPFLLPPGADWGHYFTSFNRDRALAVSVIHYPNGSARGSGTFAIPISATQRITGLLRVTQATADPAQGCTPDGTPCDAAHTVPEGSDASGIAVVNGQPGTFTLHLQSNFWPRNDNIFDPNYDTATLTLSAGGATYGPFQFYGELHHEPS